jgi:tetratricopeptide (TPR) repeat protein
MEKPSPQDDIEAYKQVIRITPDDAKAYYNLGGAYGNLGRWQDAIEAYKQAIRIKPDYTHAHLCLSSAYLEIGDKDSAQESRLEYIYRKPLSRLENAERRYKCTGMKSTLFGPRPNHNMVYISTKETRITWRCSKCGYEDTKEMTTLQCVAISILNLNPKHWDSWDDTY